MHISFLDRYLRCLMSVWYNIKQYPFIHYLHPISCSGPRGLEPIQAHIQRDAVYTTDRSPLYHKDNKHIHRQALSYSRLHLGPVGVSSSPDLLVFELWWNWSTRRKPQQTWGEQTNSTPKNPSLDLNKWPSTWWKTMRSTNVCNQVVWGGIQSNACICCHPFIVYRKQDLSRLQSCLPKAGAFSNVFYLMMHHILPLT